MAITDLWQDSKTAGLYKTTEKVTGQFAVDMIKRVNLGAEPFVLLDGACGTGIVTAKAYELVDKATMEQSEVLCGDIAPPMLEAVKQRIALEKWDNVQVQIVNFMEPKLPDAKFTHALINFGFMLVEKDSAAIKEHLRILKSGGILAVTTWKTIGWVDDVKAAFEAAGLPSIPDRDGALQILNKAPWDDPSYIKSEFEAAGFTKVQVEVLPKLITEETQEFVNGFVPMLMMLLRMFWSEDTIKENAGAIKIALEEYLTGKFGSTYGVEMVALLTTATKA